LQNNPWVRKTYKASKQKNKSPLNFL
jgi:hypothetical protein